jgi:hypothetical protein
MSRAAGAPGRRRLGQEAAAWASSIGAAGIAIRVTIDSDGTEG